MIKDMPKLESPFERELNEKGEYVVTPKISEGCEWVFNDENVLAIEKLHGTNVSIVIEGGNITSIWNRTERIPFINKGKKHIVEGILNSYERGYIDLLEDGQHFGELIGPKVNGNPYKLQLHLWIPFSTFCQKHLRYKSWGKYPKDFETISKWFETDLIPLYSCMVQGADGRKNGFVEGVVFTHPDGRMAKLRRDMFEWFNGERHNDGYQNGKIK
ncbi:MAG: RNA ligase family protein [Nanoarchaeota archaeon]